MKQSAPTVASFPVLPAPAFISQPWRKSEGGGLVPIIVCRDICMCGVDLYSGTSIMWSLYIAANLSSKATLLGPNVHIANVLWTSIIQWNLYNVVSLYSSQPL